ncbi:fasciclin-like arabinogalactan protein 11 [Abrus precatorius]|uniref:Fasciclin-like arabinogalactan protein 11 n=1 Tax=Abrus precatorius TaxID=3816 RepID=A0A8B8KQ94_ABRPR|nr:fasciclin-like arabinogalactan protein 11 [Abrus precatorius]
MKMMQESQSLISTTIMLLVALTLTLYTTTTSAQLSPIQPPTTSPSPPAPPQSQPSPPSPAVASPPATAPAPGFNTVPLVPVTPSGAPTLSPIVPKGPTIDIVQILRKAKRFSVLTRLLKTTQLINQLNSQLITSGSGGLTLFAPEDSAFSKLKAGFLNSLTDRQKVELLQFHSLSSFISISNFDTLTNPVQTQAGDDPQRLQLNVTTYGGSQVNMATGAVNATVTGTVYTDSKLAIYQVDKVLLPLDLVLPSKAPAPAPGLAKKGLPKSDKNSTSADDSAGEGVDGDGDGKALPTGTSAGCSMNVMMWVNVVGVMGFLGGVFM